MGNCGRFVKGLRIPAGRRQTTWLFTSVLEDLNAGLPRTNPASGQGWTWPRGLWVQSTLALRTLHYHGHLNKTDSSNSPAKTNYRRLTEINFRYYALSLMRTLPRGPSSVRYKGSWLERVQRSNRSAMLPPTLQYTHVYCHLINWMCVHLSG